MMLREEFQLSHPIHLQNVGQHPKKKIRDLHSTTYNNPLLSHSLKRWDTEMGHLAGGMRGLAE